MRLLLWSTAALLTGFVLDLLLGDPYRFPHIVRWMGGLIAALERALRRRLPATARGERTGGVLLVCAVLLICGLVPLGVLAAGYWLAAPLGYALESLLCWQLLAAKSLQLESMKVCRALRAGDTEGARQAVSMIVGRDTSALDAAGITRAAVETVAENTSDGVTAPLLCLMLGGGALGCLYKAANTMDSMVGYKSLKYLHFGRAAARLDDALNYLPSRLSALLMIFSAHLLRYDGQAALRVWRRDRRCHASPNSAQTESVCAGALGLQLAGPAVYHGEVVDKPYIGDGLRPIVPEDIAAANRLMYGTAVLTLILALLFRAIALGVLYAAL